MGFEAGVFERLGLQDKSRRWRPSFTWPLTWRPKVAAAIAACALVLVFGIGALVGHVTGGGEDYRGSALTGGPHSSIAAAALLSGDRDVGQVMVYAGNPTWLFMFMDDAKWQGTLRCQVVVDQGPDRDPGPVLVVGRQRRLGGQRPAAGGTAPRGSGHKWQGSGTGGSRTVLEGLNGACFGRLTALGAQAGGSGPKARRKPVAGTERRAPEDLNTPRCRPWTREK